MATLVLTSVGTLVGGPIGGAIGAMVGQSVDAMLFAPKGGEGPRLADLKVQTSSYGTPIAQVFGTMRVAGTVIWSTDLIERRSTSGGGKGRPRTTDFAYAASFAVALSGRRIEAVRRIWADGKLLRGAAGDFKARTKFRLYPGEEDQAVDPLIAAAEGAAPAFRGTAYAVFEELELAEFGNRIPSLTFEVVADDGEVTIGGIAAALSDGAILAGATPAVAGFAASADSVRAALEELTGVAVVSLIDGGAGLTLRPASGPAVVVAQARLAGRAEMVRRAAASVPGEVSIAYYDAERDYQVGLQRALLPGAAAGARAERRALPAVLSAGAAKTLAERRLDALWAARETAAVTLGWRDAEIGAGQLVTLEGERGRWRVERRTLGPMTARLELVRIAGEGGAAAAATPGRAVQESDRPHGPTVVRLIELPPTEGAGDRPSIGALAAGTLPGWRWAALSASYDAGATWQEAGRTAAPAVIGSALTALPGGSAALFDRTASLEVALLHPDMELLSCDDEALVGGANLALIGEELVQFGRAEEIGPGRYRLSRLLRGRRGTEWAAGLHAAGEGFALLAAESVAPLDLPAGVGAGATVRLIASGVGDEMEAAAELVLTGAMMRPPVPVHLRVEVYGDGRRVSWVRRSRSGWIWASGADAPLAEEAERYRVTVTGPGVARDEELTEPMWRYSAAARAADGPGPIRVDVAQVGTHGPSRAATILID